MVAVLSPGREFKEESPSPEAVGFPLLNVASMLNELSRGRIHEKAAVGS
jgi:hypothetical protein